MQIKKKKKSDCHGRPQFMTVNLKTRIVFFSQPAFMCLNITNFKLESLITYSTEQVNIYCC